MTRPQLWYVWQGVDQRGQGVRGMQLASNAQLARHALMQQRIRVRRIHRYHEGLGFLYSAQLLQPRDVTTFTRQLATLLNAGIALQQGLEVIMRGQPNTPTETLTQHLVGQIQAGQALHQALRQRREFDALFCNLVQVGEMMGALDTLLDRIATHREKTEALQAAVRHALVYPVTVLVVACLVSGALLSFVVPAFQSMFASFGAELPAITRGLLSLSQYWQAHAWQAMGAVVLLVLVSRYALFKQARWQAWGHSLCLHMPIVGSLMRHACLARWTRTLATLLAAGIPITEGLASVAGVSGNVHYARATQKVQALLMQGHALANALQQHADLFQPMLIQMCAIGEASGTLDAMLERCADQHEAQVNRLVSQLSVLMEPLLMVFLGMLIGGMVLALYLPLFQMGQVI